MESKQIGIETEDFLELFPAGIILTDKDFNVYFVNSNLSHFNLSDENVENLIGKNIIDSNLFYSTEISNNILGLRDQLGFETEIRSEKTLSGGEINIMVKGVPFVGASGFEGGIIIVEDVMLSSETVSEKMLSSNQMISIIENSVDYFFLININGEIVHSTKGRNSKLSRSISKLKLQNINEFSDDVNKLDLIEIVESSALRQKAETKIISLNYDDAPYFLEFTSIPFRKTTENGSFMILIKEISSSFPAKKEIVEDSQHLNELEKYRALITSVVDAVIGLDENGLITFWNDSSASLFGVSKSEVFNKFIGKIIPSIDEEYFKVLVSHLKENNSWESEIKIIKKDGREVIVSLKMGSVTSSNETSIFVLCYDITERAKSEKRLRISEERFRNIVINTHEYICTLDTLGKFNYINPAFKSAFEYTDDEINSLQFSDLLVDSQQFNIDELALTNSTRNEILLKTKSGNFLNVMASFTVVYDSNHKPELYNVVLNDITEQKRTHRNQKLIQSVFEASRDGIALIANRKLVIVNNYFAEMFGLETADEAVGRDPLDFVDEHDITVVARNIQNREEGSEASERYKFKGLKKDGSSFYVEAVITSYKIEEQIFILMLLRDINEEKIAQQELEKSEIRFRSITDTIDEFLWTAEQVNGKLKTVFYTSAIKKITGYAEDEYLTDEKLWIKVIHPDDVGQTIHKIKNLYRDPARNFDELEYRIIGKNGNVIWLKNKITIMRNNSGEIEKIVGICSDISYEKKAEEEIQRSAEKFKKLNDTKDRFISIISHDLRTPFSSILGFTDLLLSDPDMPQTKQFEYIQFIQESSQSMMSLVNSLLDWTRLQTGRIEFEPGKINSKSTAGKAIKMVKGAAIQKDIDIELDFDSDIFIHADENLLLQVFNNLLSNAVKFSSIGGVISVGAVPQMEKRYVEFFVKDSGKGIRKEDIDKLFNIDSKFTTPGTSGERGSGLGLSLCKEIVKKHGGEIWVESVEGEGSTFKFFIPIASSNILLLDSSHTDRILYAKLISGLFPDYKITISPNVEDAIQKVQEIQPSLIISEHKLEDMSGLDFLKKIKVLDLNYTPSVIILSSELNNLISEEYNSMGVEFRFNKPVNLKAFKKAIENCLKKIIYN